MNEEEGNEGAFLCSANFVGGQVDFRSVRPFVRPSHFTGVYPCVEAIILWRCGHITMKLGTHVHHDVKCKLWKNKMALTYITRLDELGNCWRFASDLPLCWSYSSMKMWSYYREIWYTCTSWYKILDLQARLWFWPKKCRAGHKCRRDTFSCFQIFNQYALVRASPEKK